MDESIRNAEKLIAEANAALARMKNDISNDDLPYIIDGNKDCGQEKRKKPKPVLNLEGEFFSSFLDLPKKIPESGEFLDLQRKNSNHENSIDEINSKIEAYKQQLHEKERRKKLEAWHLNRKELVTSRSRECVVPAVKTASDTNLSRKSVTRPGPSDITNDLKGKLLLTQEIVDRGIQTAREINESVDIIKSKPLKTSRFDGVSLSKSKSSEKLTKSESKVSVKSVDDVKKCKKCNGQITAKKFRAQKRDENVLVTKVQARDSNPPKCKALNLQQLPSLNIQGDLICQKIPSVDILPGRRGCLSVRANTALESCSHEQVLSNRIDRVLNDIKKWNSLTQNIGKKSNMECSNCGVAMSVRDRFIDSEQIDELLRMCDYNVFDPRIDEFAECCQVKKEDVKFTQTEEEPPPEPEKHLKTLVLAEESPVVEEHSKITDRSKELTRKYWEKAAELETDHLEFETILRDVFDKIDESRELFTNCEYLNQITKNEKRKVSLTITKPFLLSYTGSAEEIDDCNSAVIRPKKLQKQKMSSKEIRKKLEKKELRTNCKVLSSVGPVKDSKKEKGDVEMRKFVSHEPKEVRPGGGGGTGKDSVDDLRADDENKKTGPDRGPNSNVAEEPAADVSEAKESRKSDVVFGKFAEESAQQRANTGSEYESDFEEESLDEMPEAVEKDAKNKPNLSTNRLSTITEVDSDVNGNDAGKDENEERITRETPNRSGCENLSEVKLEPGETVLESRDASDDDTEKLVKQVNKELQEVVTLSGKRIGAIRDAPDHVTEPLKQVLDALKNQFERTELLADKLTESIREVKKPEDMSDICRKRDIIHNLRRARKDIEKPKTSDRTHLLDSLLTASPEDDFVSGKSSGELVIPNGRQQNLSADDISTAGNVRNFTEKSYSEGEISELEVFGSERSSPSLGEVINENCSERSGQNSGITFP